jgi:hypothetical protein
VEADVLLKGPSMSKPVLLLPHILLVIVKPNSPSHYDSTYRIKILLLRACPPLLTSYHVDVFRQRDIHVAIAYLSSVEMVSNKEWTVLIVRLKDNIGSQVAMHETEVVHVLNCIE